MNEALHLLTESEKVAVWEYKPQERYTTDPLVRAREGS